MIENPSQSKAIHADPFGNPSPNFIDRIKRSFKIDARERFPAIELFTVSIEISVIVRGKCGLASDFPGEQAAGEWKSNEDADVALLCEREKQVFGSLPKNIEDDLHRSNPGEFNCFQRFFHLFDAHTVVKNFACLLQLLEHGEYFWPVIDFGGWTVQLDQIESI